ncbi:MAG: macro domain-containing protein [Fusobacteriaceae bacterium]|jgi:O-acetyl-ADP-ribose deacetylase (regulator of RNase III)|nr:macro domain-containing protein [Fusobacteriaceae bacterium]
MPLSIVRQDITKMQVDAIVNAANKELLQGGGVCGAIFRAAGSRELQAACDKFAPIKTGASVITPGFALPAKYVIHTAGPRYRDGRHGEEELLRSSYQKSLALAVENGCQSVAFPLISSGIYGYPKEEALRVATESIRDFLFASEAEPLVYLVIFEPVEVSLPDSLRRELASRSIAATPRTEDELVCAESNSMAKSMEVAAEKYHNEQFKAMKSEILEKRKSMSAEIIAAFSLNEIERKSDMNDVELEKPFSTVLLQLIAKKGKTDAEVYKRANIDRKLFSKIRNPNYTPGKKTVLALIVALELSPDEAEDLMRRAGFAFSGSILLDVIVKKYIAMKKYDIFEINNILFYYKAPLLGVVE